MCRGGECRGRLLICVNQRCVTATRTSARPSSTPNRLAAADEKLLFGRRRAARPGGRCGAHRRCLAVPGGRGFVGDACRGAPASRLGRLAARGRALPGEAGAGFADGEWHGRCADDQVSTLKAMGPRRRSAYAHTVVFFFDGRLRAIRGRWRRATSTSVTIVTCVVASTRSFGPDMESGVGAVSVQKKGGPLTAARARLGAEDR